MSGVSGAVDQVLHLRGLAAYALVGGLVGGEAAVLLGFVLPGETAALLGGVLAEQAHVSLVGMLVVVVGAAIVGDSIGYEVGRTFGPRLLATRILRRRERQLERAQAYLRTKGGRAVVLARLTAFLRAVMPGLAGIGRMPYRRFLAFNALGAVLWGVSVTMLGYTAGAGYHEVERVAGRASIALLVLVVIVAVVLHLRRRTAERNPTAEVPMSARATRTYREADRT